MKLRAIYLQQYLSVNGRNALSGRVLFDKFKELSDDILLGHSVIADDKFSNFTKPEVKNDLISFSIVRKFKPNVIFLEGGLFSDDKGTWRLPREIAIEVLEYGCAIIVADVEMNRLYQQKEHYREAGDFFNALASYGENDSSHPVYGTDTSRFWKGERQILCKPEKMIISEWLRPVYQDVPEILVGLPVRLSSWDSILASCNIDTTGTLHLDNWVDHLDACPFASVVQRGNGFAAIIAGSVSNDVWLEGCPHNTRWLTNVAQFLAEEGSHERLRRTSHHRSPHLLFLSHRSVDKELVRKTAIEIKRKGVGIWFDEEQLVPSHSLIEEINNALGKMTHFVIFWSSNCVNAPWVERELRSGITQLIENKVPLIIVRLDTTPVPTIISDIYRIEAAGESPEQVGFRIVDTVERLSKL